MKNAIVPGSLTDVTQRGGATLAESFLNVAAIVIVDVSGSMGMGDAPGNIARYEAACNELQRLQAEFPGNIAVIAFSDKVEFCPAGVPVYMRGSTDMAQALRFVQVADGTGIKLILVSDGEPNDAEETIAVAVQFVSHIDTIYIGPEGGRGYQFLQRLANANGGIAARSTETAMFSEPVRQLLASTA